MQRLQDGFVLRILLPRIRIGHDSWQPHVQLQHNRPAQPAIHERELCIVHVGSDVYNAEGVVDECEPVDNGFCGSLLE